MRRELTARQRQDRRARRYGLALLTLNAALFIGAAYGAYKVDEANGISPAESLAMWGIGSVDKRPSWRLVVETETDSFIVDTGLSATDCGNAATAIAGSAYAPRFTDILCEKER